jgi:hypothetical protein
MYLYFTFSKKTLSALNVSRKGPSFAAAAAASHLPMHGCRQNRNNHVFDPMRVLQSCHIRHHILQEAAGTNLLQTNPWRQKSFQAFTKKDLKKRAPAETSWSFLFCKKRKNGGASNAVLVRSLKNKEWAPGDPGMIKCGVFEKIQNNLQPVRLPGGWCWFVPREKCCWLAADGWFVPRGKYRWLVADNPNEQGKIRVESLYVPKRAFRRFVLGLLSSLALTPRHLRSRFAYLSY